MSMSIIITTVKVYMDKDRYNNYIPIFITAIYFQCLFSQQVIVDYVNCKLQYHSTKIYDCCTLLVNRTNLGKEIRFLFEIL